MRIKTHKIKKGASGPLFIIYHPILPLDNYLLSATELPTIHFHEIYSRLQVADVQNDVHTGLIYDRAHQRT